MSYEKNTQEEKTPIGKLWNGIYQKWPNEEKKSCMIRESDGENHQFLGEGITTSQNNRFLSVPIISQRVHLC